MCPNTYNGDAACPKALYDYSRYDHHIKKKNVFTNGSVQRSFSQATKLSEGTGEKSKSRLDLV